MKTRKTARCDVFSFSFFFFISSFFPRVVCEFQPATSSYDKDPTGSSSAARP